MKITGTGPIKTPGEIRKAAKTASTTSFADILAAAETEGAGASLSTTGVEAAALSNLLALQEISEEEVHRRKLVQQGKGLLDVLEELRRRLLTGSLPYHVIRDLSRQLAIKKQMVADPKLTELIEDIELRAAVELAKLEVALSPPAPPDAE